MNNNVLYVGLDVHKNSIDIAIAEAGGEIRHYGAIGGKLKGLEKVIRKLHSKGSELHFGYQAGPCGYQVYRFLKDKGYSCLVAAPSLIPRRPGDRIKCDRRDALSLARLLRAGELTAVRVPDPDDEAMRIWSGPGKTPRAWNAGPSSALPPFCCATATAIRARLPGAGVIGDGCGTGYAHPAQQIVLQEYLAAVQEATARVDRLTAQSGNSYHNGGGSQ